MKRRLLFAMASIGLGTVPAAQADSNWLSITAMGWQQTPGWFVAPGIEGGIQQLPRWNSTVSVHTAVALGAPRSAFFEHASDLRGVAPGLSIGYVFHDSMLPPWLGRRVRVGLTGTWQSFTESAHSDANTPAPASGVQYLGVDGRNITLAAIAGVVPIAETLRISRDGFDLNLRIASDFPLQPGWTLTPSVAVFGGRVRDTYNYRHSLNAGAVTFDIDERLRTTSFGGEVSAGLVWQARSFLAFNVTARGGVVWMRSRLEAADCIGAGAFSCIPEPGVFLFPSAGSATDSRSRVGFRGGASLGTSLDMGLGILNFGGFFTYDSAIPGVSNPSAAGLPAPLARFGPARIRFADGFRYGGFGMLRIPLIWM